MKKVKETKQLYFEQYGRMKGFYALIKESNNILFFNNPYQKDTLWQDDLYYTFFMHCYHLKDRLEKNGIHKRKINDFINQSDALSICADLCTYSKHAEITKHIRKSSNTRAEKRALLRGASGSGPTYVVPYSTINVDGKIYNAIELATKCINEWDDFLKNNKLPIPQGNETIYFVT